MKKRTAFISAILSLIPLGQPLLIKTGIFLSTSGIIIFNSQKVNANNNNFYFKRGIEKQNKGDNYGAISDFTKAIELDPKDGDSYHNRAVSWERLDECDRAISDYYRSIQIKPAPDSYSGIGYCKNQQEDYYGAIKVLTKAIELDPQYIDAYINRGNSKNALKDHYGAISDFTKAIEIDPKDDDAYYNRGNAKSDLKDYYGSISDYTKAIEIDPTQNDVYLNRGLSKQNIGDLKGACSDWFQSSSLGNNKAKEWVREDC